MSDNTSRVLSVLFRAALYFLLAVLPVIIHAINDCMHGHVQWSALYGWWIGCTAFYQGLIALRAFYDGTAQRHTDFVARHKTEKQQPSTT